MRWVTSYFRGVWIIPLRDIFLSAILTIVPFARADTTYPNPITATSFSCLIKTISDAVIQIGVPLAIVAIIFVGLRFVIAAASGDQAGVTKARGMLWYVLIGTAIIVGSWVIAQAVINFFAVPPVTGPTC